MDPSIQHPRSVESYRNNLNLCRVNNQDDISLPQIPASRRTPCKNLSKPLKSIHYPVNFTPVQSRKHSVIAKEEAKLCKVKQQLVNSIKESNRRTSKYSNLVRIFWSLRKSDLVCENEIFMILGIWGLGLSLEYFEGVLRV